MITFDFPKAIYNINNNNKKILRIYNKLKEMLQYVVFEMRSTIVTSRGHNNTV